MKYVDYNMGLLGPRLALTSSATCVTHVPGDAVADRLWEREQARSLAALGPPITISEEGRHLDAVFAYLSHRDLQVWTRGENAGTCSEVLGLIARRRPRASIVVSTRSAPKAQKGYPFLRFLEGTKRRGLLRLQSRQVSLTTLTTRSSLLSQRGEARWVFAKSQQRTGRSWTAALTRLATCRLSWNQDGRGWGPRARRSLPCPALAVPAEAKFGASAVASIQ